MADTDSNALTKKIGPLPIWVWMLLVFIGALVFSFVKSGKGGGKGGVDPDTGLPTGSSGDLQARQSLQQLQMAASRSGYAAGGGQQPPTIIQNYPATTTVAFPLHGSAFGNNGSPSWPLRNRGHRDEHRDNPRPWHHGRRGGPGPHGPGHHGDGHQWNGGEHDHDHDDHDHDDDDHGGGRHGHQGHDGPRGGGHHGGRPDHDHGGGGEHHGGGHGGGMQHDQHGHHGGH